MINKFYSFHITAVVGVISRHSLSSDACRRNQSNKSKLVLYKPLLSHLNKQQDGVFQLLR